MIVPRDLPILFSTPMVRALLDDRKTLTRRVLTIRGHKSFGEFGRSDTPGYDWHFRDAEMLWHDLRDRELRGRLAYAAGDRLWVREHWRTESNYYDDLAPSEMGGEETILYAADADWKQSRAVGRHRHGMHMPRWASRLTLIVSDVRVERLMEISREDAIAEGVELITDYGGPFWKRYRDGGWNTYVDCPIGSFASLWTEINGPGAWEANPWVTVISFGAYRRNIDHMEVA